MVARARNSEGSTTNETSSSDESESKTLKMEVRVKETLTRVYQISVEETDVPKNGKLVTVFKKAYRQKLLGEPVREKESLDIELITLFSPEDINSLIQDYKAEGKNKYEVFNAINELMARCVPVGYDLIGLINEQWEVNHNGNRQ